MDTMTTTNAAIAAHAAQVPTQPPVTPKGAVASLVLGIIGFMLPVIGLVPGIIAIVFGNNARKKPNGTMGMIGFVLGIITTVFNGFFLAYVYFRNVPSFNTLPGEAYN